MDRKQLNEDEDLEITTIVLNDPLVICLFFLFAWLVAAGLYQTGEMLVGAFR